MIKKQITAQAAAELINCGDTVTIESLPLTEKEIAS